jgi:hypothetical protein
MAGVVTFLKKLGSIIINVAGIAVGVGPLIAPFEGSAKGVIAKGVNDLTAIAQLVVIIEAAFPASGTGPAKLQALVPLVANIIKTSEVVSGKQIANEALFTQGATEVAQGIVDILNSIHPDEAKHATS